MYSRICKIFAIDGGHVVRVARQEAVLLGSVARYAFVEPTSLEEKTPSEGIQKPLNSGMPNLGS